MKKVVDLFLVKDSHACLPISFSNDEFNPPRIMSNSQMQKTIAEILGPQFDVKTQGLFFATGSVNSKFCYKMTVCHLSMIKKFFSTCDTDKISPKSSSFSERI